MTPSGDGTTVRSAALVASAGHGAAALAVMSARRLRFSGANSHEYLGVSGHRYMERIQERGHCLRPVESRRAVMGDTANTSGHLEVVRYEPEPLESGWWAVRDEPMLRPVFVWVEDPADDEEDE